MSRRSCTLAALARRRVTGSSLEAAEPHHRAQRLDHRHPADANARRRPLDREDCSWNVSRTAHIIVTGGGSGIGRATVLRLLREAGTVHTVDVDEPGLVGTAELADAEGVGAASHHRGARHLRRAVGRPPACAATVDRLGGLDVLVNAAGILRGVEHARVHARHVEPGDQRQPHRHVPHVPRRHPRAARVGARRDRELQLDVGGVRPPVHGRVRGEQGRHRRDDAHARGGVRQARHPRRPRSRRAASRAASPRRPAG